MSKTDPRGNTTHYTDYDAFGNLLRSVDATGVNITTQTFDVRSEMLSTKDAPLGHDTQYAYDGLGRQVRVTQVDDLFPTNNKFSGAPLPGLDPGVSWAEQTVSVYDPNGLLKETINGLGQETDFTYDSGNRLIDKVSKNVVQADGSTTDVRVQFFFDEDGNGIRQIDYRDAGKPGIVTAMTYDDLNRLVKKQILSGPSPTAVGIGNVIQTATYDLVGNEISSTDQYGFTTTYKYDPLYRVIETVLPVDKSPGTPATITVGYDLVGNKVLVTDANGNPAQLTYDADNRIATKTDGVGNVDTYQYDPDGNVLQQTHTSQGVVTKIISYPEAAYDALNRATEMDEIDFEGDPGAGAPKITY
jgi:YD repeat-containing protein